MVCGDCDQYRERQYTPKPKDRDKRVVEKSRYCGCMNHEFY